MKMAYVSFLTHAKYLNVNFAMDNTGRDFVNLVTLVREKIVFFFIPWSVITNYYRKKAKLSQARLHELPSLRPRTAKRRKLTEK